MRLPLRLAGRRGSCGDTRRACNLGGYRREWLLKANVFPWSLPTFIIPPASAFSDDTYLAGLLPTSECTKGSAPPTVTTAAEIPSHTTMDRIRGALIMDRNDISAPDKAYFPRSPLVWQRLEASCARSQPERYINKR
eukprot:519023-Amorphochlora_amoeboformis.AAC.2